MKIKVRFSDAFFLELTDGRQVWPTTINGHFRLATPGKGANILGVGERPVSEAQMIEGFLHQGLISRFRPRARERQPGNHFSRHGRVVRAIHVKTGACYFRIP